MLYLPAYCACYKCPLSSSNTCSHHNQNFATHTSTPEINQEEKVNMTSRFEKITDDIRILKAAVLEIQKNTAAFVKPSPIDPTNDDMDILEHPNPATNLDASIASVEESFSEPTNQSN
jgi:hypothetical protein